ncbi:MAG: hypothetical protein APR56_02095 [Methanosaeta sp. SDB]|nr:MAG: hypothetical protein APR56_02095 [Methanosaeta sp. SDB]
MVGFIDEESPLGRRYEMKGDQSGFYADARFLAPAEMAALLEEPGFRDLAFVQALSCEPEEMKAVETPVPGYGRGSFVVVRGVKKSDGV